MCCLCLRYSLSPFKKILRQVFKFNQQNSVQQLQKRQKTLKKEISMELHDKPITTGWHVFIDTESDKNEEFVIQCHEKDCEILEFRMSRENAYDLACFIKFVATENSGKKDTDEEKECYKLHENMNDLMKKFYELMNSVTKYEEECK